MGIFDQISTEPARPPGYSLGNDNPTYAGALQNMFQLPGTSPGTAPTLGAPAPQTLPSAPIGSNPPPISSLVGQPNGQANGQPAAAPAPGGPQPGGGNPGAANYAYYFAKNFDPNWITGTTSGKQWTGAGSIGNPLGPDGKPLPAPAAAPGAAPAVPAAGQTATSDPNAGPAIWQNPALGGQDLPPSYVPQTPNYAAPMNQLVG